MEDIFDRTQKQLEIVVEHLENIQDMTNLYDKDSDIVYCCKKILMLIKQLLYSSISVAYGDSVSTLKLIDVRNKWSEWKCDNFWYIITMLNCKLRASRYANYDTKYTNYFKTADYMKLYYYSLALEYRIKYNDQDPLIDIIDNCGKTNLGVGQKFIVQLNWGIITEEYIKNIDRDKIDQIIIQYMPSYCLKYLYDKVYGNEDNNVYSPILIKCRNDLENIFNMVVAL